MFILKLRNVSIHAPREGCDEYKTANDELHGVSIHAPREGCDLYAKSAYSLSGSFNSRTPGGVRLAPALMTLDYLKFQFTHPGRGATVARQTLTEITRVSIHAPREGCDLTANTSLTKLQEFQFTHPGRGATP